VSDILSVECQILCSGFSGNNHIKRFQAGKFLMMNISKEEICHLPTGPEFCNIEISILLCRRVLNQRLNLVAYPGIYYFHQSLNQGIVFGERIAKPAFLAGFSFGKGGEKTKMYSQY